MNRELKFRQARLDSKGNFIDWFYWGFIDDGFIAPLRFNVPNYRFTGLHDCEGKEVYEGDYAVMNWWNGGDGYEEPNRHTIFEGRVIYDQKICRFGLQTKLCDEGHVEVGLEDNEYTEIEVIENPELKGQIDDD